MVGSRGRLLARQDYAGATGIVRLWFWYMALHNNRSTDLRKVYHYAAPYSNLIKCISLGMQRQLTLYRLSGLKTAICMK